MESGLELFARVAVGVRQEALSKSASPELLVKSAPPEMLVAEDKGAVSV